MVVKPPPTEKNKFQEHVWYQKQFIVPDFAFVLGVTVLKTMKA